MNILLIKEGINMSSNEKRNNYISWDEYFMSLAKLSAMRSKDPSTQVGACIVGNDNRIYQQVIMEHQMDLMMIIFHGQEKEKTQIPNTHMFAMQK